MKTKPTQLAVKLLRENGIQPNFILCRGKKALDEERKRKIEVYANIKRDNVISMPDVIGPETANTIYVIPRDLEKERMAEKIMDHLKLENKKEPNWTEWDRNVKKIVNPSKKIKIAMIVKYVSIGDYQLTDSYLSVNESLKHAGAKNDCRVEISFINAKDLEENGVESLREFDGILVPGGFGSSGVVGKIASIKFAREKDIPFLGLCLGLQLSVVEYARNVCNLAKAHSTEIEEFIEHPVVDILFDQINLENKGGTMRLGSYPARLREGSRVASLYGNLEVSERHRHRYEVNPKYHSILRDNGLVFSGMSPDNQLVEFIELPENKFFVATQAHPEFKSSLLKPAPLFDGFVKACLD